MTVLAAAVSHTTLVRGAVKASGQMDGVRVGLRWGSHVWAGCEGGGEGDVMGWDGMCCDGSRSSSWREQQKPQPYLSSPP